MTVGDIMPTTEDVVDIQGRLGEIVSALKRVNIHLLPGGTLERYLPCYSGDFYDLSEDNKRQAINDELLVLRGHRTDEELLCRYGELFEAVQSPSSQGRGCIWTWCSPST